MKVLSEQEVSTELSTLPGWKIEKGEIVRDQTFKDFVQAMQFVNEVAQEAEAAGHHPDIDIRYNRVRLALVTHDAGGITENDLSMARRINRRLQP